ncbi:MAG: GDSL-type esterase/lipase family protein [Kiritimatiellaeota bacterium]|nr:GDSL-type esterase/lipase family protein [Kiritimatiellota bacterium]
MKQLLIGGVGLMVSLSAWAEPLAECHVRAGLPNVFAKLQQGGEVRVAYLGGSITDAEGWRVLSRQWLAAQYPQAQVQEVRATICGTGAELGACRLTRDVLQYKPDLLFVEFAVNGAGRDERRVTRTMEGIIRQTWRENPGTDICFIYTVSSGMLANLQADKLPILQSQMERVAEHYQVPSLNFGVEVARQVKAGQLVFQGKTPQQDGKVVFSGDGVHPFAETGHKLYLDTIVRAVPALKAAGQPGPHAQPAPLDAASWSRAALVPLEQIQKSGDWKVSASPSDAWGAATEKKYLPSLWKAQQPGASLTFKFRGTCFGVFGLRGPDAGQFRVTVDEGAPVNGTLFDHYAKAGTWRIQPWFYPGDLKDGEHRVRLELLAEPPDKAGLLKKLLTTMDKPDAFKENRLYLGGVLLAGELLP